MIRLGGSREAACPSRQIPGDRRARHRLCDSHSASDQGFLGLMAGPPLFRDLGR